ELNFVADLASVRPIPASLLGCSLWLAVADLMAAIVFLNDSTVFSAVSRVDPSAAAASSATGDALSTSVRSWRISPDMLAMQRFRASTSAAVWGECETKSVTDLEPSTRFNSDVTAAKAARVASSALSASIDSVTLATSFWKDALSLSGLSKGSKIGRASCRERG